MWPEVQKVEAEKRHELVLGGSEITKRLSETGLDADIFTQTSLNFLDIHDTTLAHLPDSISQLNQLQSLVLNGNKLEHFNEHITRLEKLKLLDISGNFIEKIPDAINNLTNIVTINLNRNKIGAFPALERCIKLTVIDLSNNCLTQFPDICSDKLANLAEIRLNENRIDSIPDDINKLAGLKVLEVQKNLIRELPRNLYECSKLKALNLKENPISDRRLLKLIDQCRTKQIIDYIKAHSPPSKPQEPKNSVSEPEKIETVPKKRIFITHASPTTLQVKILPETKKIREFFVGFLIKSVNFTPDSLKRFIQFQNRLHESICQRRTVATIATHDADKLGTPANLTYATKAPEALKIQPLNRAGLLSGAELFNKLQNEANNLRKEKKRNTYSGIHKFLYLIEGKETYPCLVNANGVVISFPPITNSEVTKISVDTKTIFVEITGSESLQLCKTVAEELIRGGFEIMSAEGELKLEQVRTVDTEGLLKVVFPAKNDLNLPPNLFQVIRD